MLQQLDIKLKEQWLGYDEYFIFYDDEHMTQEQAEKELEFLDWGGGCNPEKYPYYFILPAVKKPILKCIKDYFLSGRYEEENKDVEGNIS